MSKVNGIPTAKEFKKYLGRTGFSSNFKKNDEGITTILALLQNAEYWRGINTTGSLPPLRMLRKACIAWAVDNVQGRRAARTKIKDLCDVVHLRINTIIEYNYAKEKVQHEKSRLKGAMSSVHDEIRLRRGGGTGKALSSHYQVERNTTSHIPKPSGAQAKARFNQADTKLDLETWIEQVLIPQTEEDPFRQYFTAGVLPGAHLASLKNQRVKYCTPTERDDYIITIKNGAVKDADNSLYHTGDKETAFSGPGWAIYVIDFDQNLYSESHIVNEFHHSSFLAGAPVLGAGEIAVDRGRIIAITNKTGHYQAGTKELALTLEILQANGVDLKTLKVNDPFRAAGKWFSGSAAFSANGELAGLSDQVKTSAPARVQN